MRVPYRKPGIYAGIRPDPQMTQKKLDELKNKIERLKKSHPEAIREVKRLAEMGDFSENHAYQMAKGRLRGINQGILELTEQIKSAEIIKPGRYKDTVQLGCTVCFNLNGEQKSYLILGSSETNPQKNIISHNSPLGAALMGKKMGDKVMVKIGEKEVRCLIIKIE